MTEFTENWNANALGGSMQTSVLGDTSNTHCTENILLFFMSLPSARPKDTSFISMPSKPEEGYWEQF